MASRFSAILTVRLEFALLLFVAITPILLCSSSAMPRTSTLSKRAFLSSAHLAEAYGKLPLSFEINQGQTDRRVKFLSRGSGYSFFLTGGEAVLTFDKGGQLSKTGPSVGAVYAKRQSRLDSAMPIIVSVVRIKLVGANSDPKVSGLSELPGRSNYFIGNDPLTWRANVANYARVKYENVYPGVDLVYYGNQRQLEYDFVLAPGADPRQIRLSFDGANLLQLDSGGNLIVSIAGGQVIEHKPVVYQKINGMQLPIDGRYELTNRHTVGFTLARYDNRQSITIDPGLVYSTYLGGSGGDAGNGIAVDSSDNAYVAGGTGSTNFPTTAGAFQTTSAGGAFVSKINSTGSALVYSTYLGSNDTGYGIAVDSSGNAYVTGSTNSDNFPTTTGALQTTFGGGRSDGFLSKLNSSGSALVYSTYLGGSAEDDAFGIALDSLGNAYITGATSSGNFPTTDGAFQTNLKGVSNVFISKLNSSGSALLYSTYLGGSSSDTGIGIAVDSSGHAYVTGEAESSSFPITPGTFQTALRGVANAFISKLNSSGSGLVYSTYLGGTGNNGLGDNGYGIVVDAAGSAYISGTSHSSDFPTTAGAFQATFGGRYDAFVSKLNTTGSALLYSTYLGGTRDDVGNGIALDAAGDAYVTGFTESSNFPVTPGAFQTTLWRHRYRVRGQASDSTYIRRPARHAKLPRPERRGAVRSVRKSRCGCLGFRFPQRPSAPECDSGVLWSVA